MPIKINGKTALSAPKNGGGVGASDFKISKTEQKKAERRKETRDNWFAMRVECEDALRLELNSKHIPETVEQALERGGISAQEVIECVEDLYETTLSMQARKWVVSKFISKDHFARRYHGTNAYSPEVADYIMDRLIEGESLRSVCRDPHMPAPVHFLKWVAENEDLGKQYTLVQELKVEYWVERVEQESMRVRKMPIVNMKSDGTVDIMVVDNIQRSKLITDTGKWFAGKLKPKKYGQMADHVPAGGGAGGDGQAFIGNDNRLVIEGGLPDWRHQKENLEIAVREAKEIAAARARGELPPLPGMEDDQQQGPAVSLGTQDVGPQDVDVSLQEQPGAPAADNVGEDQNNGGVPNA